MAAIFILASAIPQRIVARRHDTAVGSRPISRGEGKMKQTIGKAGRDDAVCSAGRGIVPMRRTGRAPGTGARLALAFLVAAACTARAETFTVRSNGDSDGDTCGADCSLRQAINAANASDDEAVTIAFDIPGNDAHVIAPQQPLPALFHDQFLIDGYTQPGSLANSKVDSDDAIILIQIDGSTAAGRQPYGLATCALSAIRGLSITGFGFAGILFGRQSNASFCPAGSSAAQSLVLGNFIGLAPDGTSDDNDTGVFVDSTPGVAIGGDSADRNVISGNASFGILTLNPATAGTLIDGNFIGTDPGGTQPRGNGVGIKLSSNSSGALVGTEASNLIAGNTTGIAASNSQGNAILGNAIHSNLQLGIDLCAASCGQGDGVTPNDPDDADSGANDLQNFPELAGAELSYGTVSVTGTLPRDESIGNDVYLILLYANDACDDTGHGEGRRFLGAQAVTFDTGQSSFAIDFDAASSGLAPGSYLTATATRAPSGELPFDTSEFSACAPVVAGDGIFSNGFEARIDDPESRALSGSRGRRPPS
jgi:CSLREA domain-containing protein